MSVRIELTVDQIADAIDHLHKNEFEQLEDILERKHVAEIHKRTDEMAHGRKKKLRDIWN